MGFTVAAISTPRAAGGISVIRISGEDALLVASRVFKPLKPRTAVSDMAGYSCAYGIICDKIGDGIAEEIGESGDRIDDGVLSVFRSPNSYTGEDVAEISCHGGIFVTERILRLVLSCGAVPAGPGEFTKRAYLNGKVTLTGAEAVMDMIRAEGEMSRKSASALMEGALFRRIKKISDALLARLGELAAWADYPDEDLPDLDTAELLTGLEKLSSELAALLLEYGDGKLIREGIDTVICGKPNVGKSTFMNLLLGEQRCIVTDTAGTTRDIIEETVTLGDIILRLSDTAGIRDTDNQAEAIGIEMAAKKIETVALVLAIFDNSCPINEQDNKLIALCEGKRAVAIINKADKPALIDGDYIRQKFGEVITISALQKSGVSELRGILERIFKGNDTPFEMGVIANERQRLCALNAKNSLDMAINDFNSGVTLDAVTILIQEALNSLYELTGENAAEAVIDEVFSKFCVGK